MPIKTMRLELFSKCRKFSESFIPNPCHPCNQWFAFWKFVKIRACRAVALGSP